MRERIITSTDEGLLKHSEYSKKEVNEFKRRSILSLLEGPNGERVQLSVAISNEQGDLRGVNFWDLDKTLLLAEPFHAKAIDQIFPEQTLDDISRKEFHKVYFAGFKLGTSFREFDRMWRIYREGQAQYKDPLVYEKDFLGTDNPNRKLIDEPGHPEGYHERADEILQRYGRIAYSIMKAEYDKNPEQFQNSLMKPEMFQLLMEKTRLGQVNVYMTANQADFARGLVTFSGLYKYALALATDETMIGGGKEIAIEKLIEQLQDMGLVVNRARAVAIGDSIKGDVGSGVKAGLGSAILVTETTEEVQDILRRAGEDNADARELKSILGATEVEAIPTKEVKKSMSGIFNFGKKSSRK